MKTNSVYQQEAVLKQKPQGNFYHQENSASFCARFYKHTDNLLTEFEQLGSSFILDESGDLIEL